MSLVGVQPSQVFRIWSRNFLIFKRTWLISLCWVLVEPLMYLGAVGFGLGSFVNNIGGHSYADWYFPGLICTSVMMVSFFEATYSNFTKLTYSKVYSTQLLAPITINELILGDILWGASKGFLSGLGIILVGQLFHLGQSTNLIFVIPLIFLLGWIFAAFGMIVTSLVQNYDQIIYPTSGLIVPMSLFSGTYFPVEDVHPILKSFAYLLPLTHGVTLIRDLLLSTANFYWWLHLSALVFFGILLSWFAVRKMNQRLKF